MRFTLLEVSLVLLGAISFVLFAWASFRRIYAGRETPGYMKKTLFYRFFFALGMCYLMMFGATTGRTRFGLQESDLGECYWVRLPGRASGAQQVRLALKPGAIIAAAIPAD
jgi:hypothetical protein